MAILRETDSDLFTLMLTKEYQPWASCQRGKHTQCQHLARLRAWRAGPFSGQAAGSSGRCLLLPTGPAGGTSLRQDVPRRSATSVSVRHHPPSVDA